MNLKKWYLIIKNWDGGLESTSSIIAAIGGFIFLIVIPAAMLLFNLFLYVLSNDLAASWPSMITTFLGFLIAYAIVLVGAIVYDDYYSKKFGVKR